MQPIATFLFSLKYYKTVIVLIGQNFRFAKLFGVFLWISYFLVVLLIYSSAEDSIVWLQFGFIRGLMF